MATDDAARREPEPEPGSGVESELGPGTAGPPRAVPHGAGERARAALDGLENVVGGLGTAVLAAAALILFALTAAACLLGVGLRVAPAALRALRVIGDRERARLSRRGREILSPDPVPARLPAAVRDAAVRRELGWLAWHGTAGLALGLLGVSCALYSVSDLTFPLWWQLVPRAEAGDSLDLVHVHDLPGALLVGLLGLVWIVVAAAALPAMAWLQAWPGRRLLAPGRDADLTLRVAELTATRAAALDAHAAELRRIERALHDGTQNRLVAVTVLLGALRRALERDPAAAGAILDRAQDAAETSLAELRGVVRSILPPVLGDRSLPDALTGLAADCPVDCRIDADLPGRCAASVEATAYFAVAESLTNVARHSGAAHVLVRLRRRGDRLDLEITDDGRGGADERGGSGLAGIRRRVGAHDGTFTLTSPVGGPTTTTVSLPCGS